MKKLIASIAAAILLTAVILLIIWSVPKNKTEDGVSSSSELSEASAYESTDTESYTVEESFENSYGPLFLGYKSIIDTGTYKLTLVKQKRFGGNSVPVTTTTYYGDGFISITEQEGHDLINETLINSDGVYLFDSSGDSVYLLRDYNVSTDVLTTDGIRFLDSGDVLVGTVTYVYESYEKADGGRLDYLFLGGELKKMKLYDDEGDYELVGVELSTDISGARSSLPENAVIIETDY